MAHSEFVAETTPLASEPRLRGASESSTRAEDGPQAHRASVMQADWANSIRPHRSPILQAVYQEFVAH